MTCYRFSANTGFLWKDLPFLQRIQRASEAGFDAVEFHDEAQQTNLTALEAVLGDTGLPVVSINTKLGATFGCAAMAARAADARRDVDQAVAVADRVGAAAIHVLAGQTSADDAHDAYVDTLEYALAQSGRQVVIEPISGSKIPGYYLNTIDQAARILDLLNHPRLKILFDCYHIQAEEGAILEPFTAHAAKIGHVQIASYPDRNEPFSGVIDYADVLVAMKRAGYEGYFGCEYHPGSSVEAGLHWMTAFRPTD